MDVVMTAGRSSDRLDGASGSTVHRWQFAGREFDEGRWELLVDGQAVDLERKPLEVLLYLLQHAGEAVSKEELLSEVWTGRIVVEASLTNAVGKLRRALGDEGGEIIATLPRVGYRLRVPVSRLPTVSIAPGSRLAVGDSVPRRNNWQLRELLARISDGEVWLAEHAKTGQRRVFKFSLDGQRLKGLKREVTTARLLERALGARDWQVPLVDWDFEQAPFFVEFEHAGMALDRWVASDGRTVADLDLEQRLELFCQVADAVAQAHSIGVIHKDIKPANILLSGDAGSFRLRVADFGSSQIMDPALLDGLGITRMDPGQTIARSDTSGTPLYLAPEVLLGQLPTIGSDVYALGITLYQLVIGDFRRPLVAGWENDVQDPLLRQDIADAANGDPQLRLGSAAELAERIGSLKQRREKMALEQAVRDRVAAGEKRLARMRARRPWLVATFASLVLGLGISIVFLQRSLEAEAEVALQRDEAEKQAQRAEAVVKFLSRDLIGAVNPGGGGYEKKPTIEQMLAYASANRDRLFPDDPATRGSINAALGASWRTLGNNDRSIEHLKEAIDDYSQAFGDRSRLALQTRYDLVVTLSYAQQFEPAAALLDESDELAGDLLKQTDEVAFLAARARAVFGSQKQNIAMVVPALERAIFLQRAIHPDDVIYAAQLQLSLSDAVLRQGESDKAVAMLEALLADPRFDASHIGEGVTAALQLNLARGLRNLGRYKEALPLAQAAQRVSARLGGEKSWQALVQLSTVASIQNKLNDCRGGLASMRQVVSGMSESFGDRNQGTLVELGNLSDFEFKCGNPQDGRTMLQHAVDTLEQEYGGRDNVHAQVFRYELASHLATAGEVEEALRLLEGLKPELLVAGDSTPGWEHRLDALRGQLLLLSGQHDQGERLLTAALQAMEGQPFADDAEIRRLRRLLDAI